MNKKNKNEKKTHYKRGGMNKKNPKGQGVEKEMERDKRKRQRESKV